MRKLTRWRTPGENGTKRGHRKQRDRNRVVVDFGIVFLDQVGSSWTKGECANTVDGNVWFILMEERDGLLVDELWILREIYRGKGGIIT